MIVTTTNIVLDVDCFEMINLAAVTPETSPTRAALTAGAHYITAHGISEMTAWCDRLSNPSLSAGSILDPPKLIQPLENGPYAAGGHGNAGLCGTAL